LPVKPSRRRGVPLDVGGGRSCPRPPLVHRLGPGPTRRTGLPVGPMARGGCRCASAGCPLPRQPTAVARAPAAGRVRGVRGGEPIPHRRSPPGGYLFTPGLQLGTPDRGHRDVVAPAGCARRVAVPTRRFRPGRSVYHRLAGRAGRHRALAHGQLRLPGRRNRCDGWADHYRPGAKHSVGRQPSVRCRSLACTRVRRADP
jgi:hypothetical protein